MINRENKKQFDIGLAVLRVILCFLVIVHHYYNYFYSTIEWGKIIIKLEYFSFQVRTFFIISFYFSYKTFISFNFKKIYQRFERLLIPYILWPIIFWLINNLLIKISNKNLNLNHTFYYLKYQLLFGNIFIQSFWFQWVLIFITFIFTLIFFVFKKNYIFVLLLLEITSFIFQYNGINHKNFSNYDNTKMYSFGRIIEMIPNAIAGFVIAFYGVIDILRKNNYKTIILCLYAIYFILNFKIFESIRGFDFCGIRLYLMSICLFITFTMFPSEKIKNKTILKFIKQITNHTAGIYYTHDSIYNILKNYNDSMKYKTIEGCIYIYLICYFINFIGSKLLKKTKLRHLFE